MSHCIHGYVAKFEDLQRVFGQAARLPQGLGFVPIDVHNPLNPREEIVIVKIQQVAWIETNFFGGFGTQSVELWENGKVVYEVEERESGSPISEVLKRMGVKKGDSDEFDACDLGHYRNNEDFAIVEISVEEHMRLQEEWNKENRKRASDTARTGDYVSLLVGWQDVSGIPLIILPAGTTLKVLFPDLTTGGVVVQYEEFTFSLTPDEYEIVEPPHE